ncbi:MAG: hypothetical protein RLZZ70_513 [Candidatus Parcubacteria bacterium]|jgi:hypothetical protein
MTGCINEITINNYSETRYTPSRVEQQLDTSQAPIMCPTTDLAIKAVEHGWYDPSCQPYSIFVPQVRSYIEIYGRWYTIFEIGPPNQKRFWLEPGRYQP